MYRGYLWDPVLRMYHVRHRVYDPAARRWLQPDPLGTAAGPNLYAYCEGDPVNYYDPYGLFSVMRWIYTGDGNASDEVYEAAQNAAASTIPPFVIFAADAVDTPTGRRILGGLQAVGGAVTTVGGVAIGWTGVGVGVAAVGFDMTQAGLRQVYTGEWTPTLLSQGIDWGAAQAGMNADDRPLFVGLTTGLIQGAAGYTGAKTLAKQAGIAPARAGGTGGRGPKPTWPANASDMDRFLGTRGVRVPDAVTTPGRGRVTWSLGKCRVTLEQHPYHPNAPIWHRGPHWHLDIPGAKHIRYLPGDSIPGY